MSDVLKVAEAARLLKLPEVVTRTTWSRSKLYAAIALGEFPRPVRISANRVAWPEAAVDVWIAGKIAAATGTPYPRTAAATCSPDRVPGNFAHFQKLGGDHD